MLGCVTNLGSGFEISIGDTAKLIAELMGVEIEIVSDAERIRPENSEVERLVASNARARERMGWTPEYADLAGFRRGLQHTIEWFRDPKNLTRYKTDIYNI
jgi:nucleoside-diphosphate-sugar epimerase